jgi:hypothetical protein
MKQNCLGQITDSRLSQNTKNATKYAVKTFRNYFFFTFFFFCFRFPSSLGTLFIHHQNFRNIDGQEISLIFRYQDLIEIYSVSAKTIINDAFSHSENVKIRVIKKLPNSEQSYKGKVKTHKYINRKKQSTTGKL